MMSGYRHPSKTSCSTLHKGLKESCSVCVINYWAFILSSVPDPDKRLQALWVTCDQLPKNNKANFRWVSTAL